MSKKNLLSIGEISKITDASIYSLRYYERIQILKPAYIEPDTGYRYYAFEQIFWVKIIMMCVELDIPLKTLVQFKDKEGQMDYLTLLAHGKEIAEKKLHDLKRRIRFIDDMDLKISLVDQYGDIQNTYTRRIPQKNYYVLPFDKRFEDAQMQDILNAFMAFDYKNLDYAGEFIEYGIMMEHSPSETKRYVFVEMEALKPGVVSKKIPKGLYHCVQNERIAIEHVEAIFGSDFNEMATFLAIETLVLTNKGQVGKPRSELRVIELNGKK